MHPTTFSRTVLLEAVSIHLGLLTWLITHQLSQQLRNFNLSLPQFVVLAALLARREPCLMGQLAQLTRQTPATLTGIVDRLLKMGLVQRTCSQTDRRLVLVQATPAGIDLAERVETEFLRNISCSLTPLTDEMLFTVEQSLISILSACTAEPSTLPTADLDDEPSRFLLVKTFIPA